MEEAMTRCARCDRRYDAPLPAYCACGAPLTGWADTTAMPPLAWADGTPMPGTDDAPTDYAARPAAPDADATIAGTSAPPLVPLPRLATESPDAAPYAAGWSATPPPPPPLLARAPVRRAFWLSATAALCFLLLGGLISLARLAQSPVAGAAPQSHATTTARPTPRPTAKPVVQVAPTATPAAKDAGDGDHATLLPPTTTTPVVKRSASASAQPRQGAARTGKRHSRHHQP